MRREQHVPSQTFGAVVAFTVLEDLLDRLVGEVAKEKRVSLGASASFLRVICMATEVSFRPRHSRP